MRADRRPFRRDVVLHAGRSSTFPNGRAFACVQIVDPSEGTSFCMRAGPRPFRRFDYFWRAKGRTFRRDDLLHACRSSTFPKGRPFSRVQVLDLSEGSTFFGVQKVEPSEGTTSCMRAKGRTFRRDDLLHACRSSIFPKGRALARVQKVDLSEGSSSCTHAAPRFHGGFDPPRRGCAADFRASLAPPPSRCRAPCLLRRHRARRRNAALGREVD